MILTMRTRKTKEVTTHEQNSALPQLVHPFAGSEARKGVPSFVLDHIASGTCRPPHMSLRSFSSCGVQAREMTIPSTHKMNHKNKFGEEINRK